MSNATDSPKKQGQRRRRRRGGKNRNNNQNRNQSNRSQGDSNSKGGGRSRSGKGRGRGRKPIPLSWWQKALIAVGLYEDPNKRKGKGKKSAKKSGQAPKSNTRNARTKERGDRPKPDTTSQRAKRDRKRRGGDPSTVESSKVYVGNLSYDSTEEDMKELFKGVGNVRRVEIVYNRNTHRSKGYGFVEMMNKEDAIRSVEVLHDQPFMGRNITVSGAKSKTDGDEEDNEPAMEIKASDVELAPLPEKSESEPQAETAEAESAPESAPEKVEQPAAEATPESESSEEERKQD